MRESSAGPPVEIPDMVPAGPGDSQAPPAQSQEDTDLGWGERPGPDDDERLYRERPPHWDSV